MRKNKIVFMICTIILLTIIFELIVYMRNGIQISELNNMYKDIKVLEDKVLLYYLDNGELPTRGEAIYDFYGKSINPNDGEIYYEIDLSKLENMNLFYGNKKLGKKDVYIINEESHTVYYYMGCEYDNEIKYTREIDYEYVEMYKY